MTTDSIKPINAQLALETDSRGNRRIVPNPATFYKAYVLACAKKKPIAPLPYVISTPDTRDIDLWVTSLTDDNSPQEVVFNDAEKLAELIKDIDWWKYDEKKAKEIRSHFAVKGKEKAQAIVLEGTEDLE